MTIRTWNLIWIHYNIYIYMCVWKWLCVYICMIIHMYIVHESHIGITKCFLFPCIDWPVLIYRLDMIAHKQCSVSMKDPFAHTKEYFCGKQHKKWCLGNRGKWDTACFVRHSCLFETLYHQAHHHAPLPPHHLRPQDVVVKFSWQGQMVGIDD